MILGTAGHVDHGKTALVRALTGVDTDRLQEEKRRGITLELGFAHLQLPDGSVAGVVDVPGHERFVKAMVAGAGGVDLVLFVVAADEGVMPQTREHLDICRLLGVKAGVIALTKSDLLPALGAEWLDLVRADLAALTEGTFLEDAAVVPCSAQTGEGLDALREEVGRMAASLPARPADGPLFLPVDRAFTLKGFGTVVTGTLLSGQLQPEASVSLLPGLPGPLRVRGVQVHGEPVPRALAGQRVAVNLVGVEAEAVSRGMVLTREGELPSSHMLDVEVTLLPTVEAPLPRRAKLLLHLGTSQVEATLALLDVAGLEPGGTALAQLRLAAPVAALPGQRFILRGPRVLPGRGATLAGGRVLSLTPPRRRAGAGAVLAPLVDGDAEARLRWFLRQAGYLGLTARELGPRSGLAPRSVERGLERLSTQGAVLLVDRERRLYVAAEVMEQLRRKALALLEAFHARAPQKEGLAREELRQRLSPELEPKLLARVLLGLTEAGIVEAAGDRVQLRGRGGELSVSEAGLREQLFAQLQAAGLGPPTVEALAQALHTPLARAHALLQNLADAGRLAKVSEDLYFERGALELLRARLVAHLQAHREISTQGFKELVAQSRKYVIPLSEYFDREKVTLRVGEKRVLRRG